MKVLTDCEIEICHLAANGYSVKQIAFKLSRTESTITTERSNILRKLGANNFVHAIAIYERKNHRKL